MQNVVTTITNLTCLLPLYLCYINKDYMTLYLITIVSIASLLMHVMENHHHGMPGLLNVSKQTSWMFNQIDISCALVTAAWLLYLYYNKYGLSIVRQTEVMWLLSPFLFLLLSNYDKYNAAWRTWYIITHSIWHITVFLSIYYYLNHFIYN